MVHSVGTKHLAGKQVTAHLSPPGSQLQDCLLQALSKPDVDDVVGDSLSTVSLSGSFLQRLDC